MTTQAEIGMNRTGIATSPKLSAEMVQGVTEFPPDIAGDEREIAQVREAFAKESEPLGSVPPPTTVQDMAATALRGLRGLRPTQFIDKLGERLAFERSGVRLYEALISKHDAFGSFDGGPARADLEKILREEYEHFQLLVEAVRKVGGDPTVVTPSADLHATMTEGVLKVMVDPRTTLVQCLEAALNAELNDNEAWDGLSILASHSGEDELARLFTAARAHEAEHLTNVRAWVAAAQNRPA
jgi:rubrerythrin